MTGSEVSPPPPLSARAKAVRWLAGVVALVVILWLSVRHWPIQQMFGGRWSIGPNEHGQLALAMDVNGRPAWSVTLASVLIYAAVLTVIHWLRVLRMRGCTRLPWGMWWARW